MSAGTELELTEDRIVFEGQPSKTEGGKVALWVDGVLLETDNEDMCSFPLDPLGLYRVEITYLGSKKGRYSGVGNAAHAKKHAWFGEVLTTQEIAKRVGVTDQAVRDALCKRGLSAAEFLERHKSRKPYGSGKGESCQ